MTFPQGEVYTAEANVNDATGTWPGLLWTKDITQKSYGLLINTLQARISETGGGAGWCTGHNWASTALSFTGVAGIWSLTWIETGNIIANFPTVGDITSTNTLYSKDEDLRLLFGGISSGSGSMEIDWIRVRKYAATPPSFSFGTVAIIGPELDLGPDVVACNEALLDAGAGFVTYDWNTGGTGQTELVDVTGTYSVTVTNEIGCIQKDTIEAEINTVDNTTTVDGNTITANQDDAAYRWLDCNDSYQFITGNTDQSFIATISGNYAVEVTNGVCVDTSDCVEIIIIKITDNTFENNIKIYPNITTGKVNINLGKIYAEVQINVRSVEGKLINQHYFNNNQNMIIDIQASAGVYLIEIISKEGTAVFKVIKQ